jgi:hypothetical protein
MVRESIGREFDPVVAREFLEMGPVLTAAYQQPEVPAPALEV